jgi:hypothetical protein
MSDSTTDAAGRRPTREFLTPLAAAAAWAVLFAGGALWPPLAPLSARLAVVGEVVLVTLVLQAVHECGHLAAGALVGLPFRAVTLGLITVERVRDAAGPRLRWDVNRSWKRFAGCVEREITPAPGVRGAMTVSALGGPLASLVAAALLLGAPEPWRGFGFVSLVIGVMNALPIAALGQASDGMLVYRLWSRRPADVAWRAELYGGPAAPTAAPTAAP